MRRRTHLLVGLAVVGLAIASWTARGLIAEDPGPAEATPHHRRVGAGFADALAKGRARGARIPWGGPAARADHSVRISGRVLERGMPGGVGGVEVVFRGAAGEESTISDAAGKYALELPAGVYRAFVRDDFVLSVGRSEHVRLPGLPSADSAGAPDEALMPLVVATRDAEGIDLSVRRGGTVRGRVVDRAGRPIANAVVRAIDHGIRPTLGTDVAETAEDGAFELRLPTGGYVLEATHARFAGAEDGHRVALRSAGDIETVEVVLTAGCVIAGRVVGAGRIAANDGAIERQWGTTDLEFAPTGRIEADGTFRWTTTDEGDVVLRAWPWKAPPSPSQRFGCRDGARFDGVVFELPDHPPDIAGALVDATGAPVPFAHLDLQPLDPGGIAQQERTDEAGQFGVFHMPAGRYAVTAHVAGRGIVTATVTSPQRGLSLVLSGTGRLEGTTAQLESGSFELVLGACLDGSTVPLPRAPRLVAITNHRFTVEDVPACDLQFVAMWRGDAMPGRITVPAGGVAQLELGIGSAELVLVETDDHDHDHLDFDDSVH